MKDFWMMSEGLPKLQGLIRMTLKRSTKREDCIAVRVKKVRRRKQQRNHLVLVNQVNQKKIQMALSQVMLLLGELLSLLEVLPPVLWAGQQVALKDSGKRMMILMVENRVM